VADQLRVALLGYGLAGRYFHAPLIRLVEGMAVTSVVTANAERAAAAREDDDYVRILADPGDVWAKPDDYDLVVIATANRVHLSQARAALSVGLPVVVDKPLCRTSAEATALRDQAAGRATVFQNRRWDGDFLALRAAVEAGELGTLHRFESRFERWRSAPKGYWRESGDPVDLGGLLYDLGAHLVDQAIVLLGPVERVQAQVRRVRPWAEVDDDAFLALTHTSGAVSQLWMSSVVAAQGPRFRALGTAGAWETHDLDGQEDALRAGRSPYDVPEHHARLLRSGDSLENLDVVDSHGDWPAFYRAVRPWVLEQAAPPVQLDEVVATLRVLEQAAAQGAGP
jgi:predicted dehydrogenase